MLQLYHTLFFPTIFLDKGDILLEVYFVWYFMASLISPILIFTTENDYEPHCLLVKIEWSSKMEPQEGTVS